MSKQVTAWDVWERVLECIASEAGRFLQQRYVTRDPYHWGLRPPCGTAACRAGWFAIHVLGRLPNAYKGESASTITLTACKMTGTQLYPLISGSACAFESGLAPSALPRGSYNLTLPGTPEYHRRGVEGLRTWMRQHEAHLKATIVEVHDNYPRYDVRA